ncbi:MAG: 16S rRNA processing protein RimM [Bacilli bacterium]|nr:16S rRNA processing protein RimM [Bacilli bacterium]
MDYIYVGKLVNTHGIKGEVKIISNFEYKNKVFVKDKDIYIGDNKVKETINSYRHHKNFEMITLNNYTNINEVLKYKGMNVYVNRDDLGLLEDEYLYQDLIGLNIKNNLKTLGKVKDVMYNNGNVLLKIEDAKEYYIPLNEHFIKKVNLNEKIIEVENIEGLI